MPRLDGGSRQAGVAVHGWLDDRRSAGFSVHDRVAAMPAGPPLNPAVILVRTQEAGNIGAAARAMANMGLSRLLLAAPRADPAAPAALAFATGARHLLESASIHPDLPHALRSFAHVVGTTSERERVPNPAPIAPRELPEHLATLPADTPAALVFGPEASGLTRDELALCHVVVQIPCAPDHPTLNLAQAVLVLAYELSRGRQVGAFATPATPADPDDAPAVIEQIDGLATQYHDLMERIGFARDSSYPAVARDLRQLLTRAAPSRREVRILRGVARRAIHALGSPGAVIESLAHPPEPQGGETDSSEESE
jgi:TrmH family RNA methyltransferase